MKFKRYSKIENSYRAKTIGYIYELMLTEPRKVWHVQEKAHGSNLAIYYDGTEFKYAKRSQFIEGSFYSYDRIKQRVEPKIRELWKAFPTDKANEITHIVIYGELIGGRYPHNDILHTQATTIQSGVWYCPDNEFFAYELRAYAGEYEIAADVSKAEALFEKYDFLHAKTLFTGSLEDCLEYDINFNSLIPSYMGLPELEGPNLCEGVVVRPERVLHSPTGRVLLKKKQTNFSENISKKVRKAAVALEGTAAELVESLEGYINENRLNAVISKEGPEAFDKKSFGKLLKLFTTDVLEDFVADHLDQVHDVQDNMKIIRKMVGKRSATFIRPHWLKMQ